MKILAILACLFSWSVFASSVDLLWLEESQPEADFNRSVEVGDFRFRGLVHKAGLVFPPNKLNIVLCYDTHPIDATSLRYGSAELSQLIKKSKSYSTIYNELLFNYLTTNELLPSCDVDLKRAVQHHY